MKTTNSTNELAEIQGLLLYKISKRKLTLYKLHTVLIKVLGFRYIELQEEFKSNLLNK
jgi:surface polysaccharide O-acyltransferase-like enzyme